jgi:hypothetical protein
MTMTTPSRTYTDNAAFYERFASYAVSGPHMQLDLDIHWQWSNPLNIIPVLALLLVIIAAVGLIVR